MHFCTTHTIAGLSPSALEALFFREDLNIAICAALGMERTLLHRSETAGVLKREVLIHPQREVPAPIARVIGERHLAYTEQMTCTYGSLRGDWRITPKLFSDKVSAVGSVQFLPHAQGVERRVEGEVDVRIFGIGRLVESYIVADIERSFAKAADLTRAFVRDGGADKAPA